MKVIIARDVAQADAFAAQQGYGVWMCAESWLVFKDPTLTDVVFTPDWWKRPDAVMIGEMLTLLVWRTR